MDRFAGIASDRHGIAGLVTRNKGAFLRKCTFFYSLLEAISEKDQAVIFERFFRVKDQNTSMIPGLGGLYISANIIKRHNGNIWVESKMGTGSTFGFTLPVTSQ
jgi:hypothetical protein